LTLSDKSRRLITEALQEKKPRNTDIKSCPELTCLKGRLENTNRDTTVIRI